MALLFMDGFDSYGTSIASAPSPSGILARKYSGAPSNGAMTVRAGRLDGYCLRFYNDDFNTDGLRPAALTTNATLVVGVAVKFGSILDNSRFVRFVDGANVGVQLLLRADGELSVYNVRTSTQLGITSGLGLLSNTWYYVEIKVVAGASGSFDVHVAGVSVLSASGVDTSATVGHDYNATFALTNPNYSALTTDFDDLYCVDGSGSVNNDLLGNMRVVTLRPDGAGITTEFTPDSGSNYARVNEAICGDDTNYVEDSTAGHKDLYVYDALNGISVGIKGVMVCTDCRETDASPFSLKTVCKSGTTEDADAGQAISSTTFVTKRRVLETNPDTTAAWTYDGVDAAQFGVQVA
jgi:hypothetical protein